MVEERLQTALHGCIHDLRGPLAAIQAHADLLVDGILGPLSAEQEESVGSILNGVQRMEALFEALRSAFVDNENPGEKE